MNRRSFLQSAIAICLGAPVVQTLAAPLQSIAVYSIDGDAWAEMGSHIQNAGCFIKGVDLSAGDDRSAFVVVYSVDGETYFHQLDYSPTPQESATWQNWTSEYADTIHDDLLAKIRQALPRTTLLRE